MRLRRLWDVMTGARRRRLRKLQGERLLRRIAAVKSHFLSDLELATTHAERQDIINQLSRLDLYSMKLAEAL